MLYQILLNKPISKSQAPKKLDTKEQANLPSIKGASKDITKNISSTVNQSSVNLHNLVLPSIAKETAQKSEASLYSVDKTTTLANTENLKTQAKESVVKSKPWYTLTGLKERASRALSATKRALGIGKKDQLAATSNKPKEKTSLWQSVKSKVSSFKDYLIGKGKSMLAATKSFIQPVIDTITSNPLVTKITNAFNSGLKTFNSWMHSKIEGLQAILPFKKSTTNPGINIDLIGGTSDPGSMQGIAASLAHSKRVQAERKAHQVALWGKEEDKMKSVYAIPTDKERQQHREELSELDQKKKDLRKANAQYLKVKDLSEYKA